MQADEPADFTAIMTQGQGDAADGLPGRGANVRMEASQDERPRPVAAAHVHFLMPDLA